MNQRFSRKIFDARLPFTLLIAVIAACPNGNAADLAKPNIVFILVDDMGYGDPGCFNPASKIATPHIDSIARDGMRFTDAHAAGPLCHMSRYGLLTGRYPFRTDVSKWPTKALIDPGQATIATVLKSEGYRTAMVGKWHLGFDEDGYENPLPGGPLDCGFDSFFGIRASTDIPPYFYIDGDRAVAAPTDTIEANASEGWSPIQGEFWRAGGIAPDLKLQDVLPRFTEEAISVIEGHAKSDAKDPLFLYLAFPSPHTPWLPTPEFVGQSSVGMYGDFVLTVDAMIGRVMASLDASGLSDNTLLVFTSDNGPTWYPKDAERFHHDSAGGLRGMKADAWEAGHRIPFIARWPGEIKPGSTCDQTISFVDMLSTFADLTGAPLATVDGPDSFSILPLLHGDDEVVRASLALLSGRGLKTIRSGPWKLIMGLGSGGFTQPSRVKPEQGTAPAQLYNLDEDPGETKNLYFANPQKVKELSSLWNGIDESERTRP